MLYTALPIIDGPRACRPDELPEVITLVNQAMRQGTDQSMLTDYPLVFSHKNLKNVRMLKVDGELASVVPFLPHEIVMDECHFRIGVISPTATAIHHRRKGYGLRCLWDCLELMDRAECELSVLWTLQETFPFYEHAEYAAVRPQGWKYRYSKRDADLFQDSGDQIVEYALRSRHYLDSVQQMHEREVYGVVRIAEEYPVLFSLPKMKTLLALRDSQPVAYLVVSKAVNKPGLIEGGGDPKALEGLVHYALRELRENASVDGHGNLTPTTLGGILERISPTRRQVAGESMMIRINAPQAFLDAISSWLARAYRGGPQELSISISGTADVVGFRFAEDRLQISSHKFSQHMRLSRSELTAWIFGPHPARSASLPEIMGDSSPYYFPIWWLDRS
jgi:hypothetical protein